MEEEQLRYLAEHLMLTGVGGLTARDRRVLSHIGRRLRAAQAPGGLSEGLTLGERLADRVAGFGGSWSFIGMFAAFLVGWALLNTDILRARAFDPYPYVFLNLVLSMLAAIQAPIILMAQNRQAARDRVAVARDYEVNLKAEQEIARLHRAFEAGWAEVLARLPAPAGRTDASAARADGART